MNSEGFLKSHGVYPSQQAYPVIESSKVRAFIQGSLAGTTNINSVQPGGELKLNLGNDKHLIISSTKVLAQNQGKEEDKSTWFVTDKKKYHVKVEELAFSVQVQSKRCLKNYHTFILYYIILYISIT